MSRSPISIQAVLLGALSFCISQNAWAIPSPLNHVHNATTVHWKEAGSPALPWDNATANTNDHNHLTADNISNLPKWDINKAWDNRTLHSSFNALDDWSHGMILTGNAVRYGWESDVPNDARDAVEVGFNDWVSKATAQYNLHDQAWDRLAIDFDRVDTGAKEITVDFVATLDGAYADFSSSTQVIRVLTSPTISLQTSGGLKLIRLGDAGVGDTSINVSTPWSYDGTPNSTATDFDYSDDGGTTWHDAPPIGFGNLNWCAATCNNTIAPANSLDIFEMDFRTIINHEIGHAIGLGHTGDGAANIMRDDIADRAAFGNTFAIDNDSALAIAINYTYSVPEPTSGVMAMAAGLALVCFRRRPIA